MSRNSLLAAVALTMAAMPGQADDLNFDFHFNQQSTRREQRKDANSTDGNRKARGAHKAAKRAAMKARRR